MEILILIILVLLNGFFALSEIALVSVKKRNIERRAQKGSRRAKTVLKLLENPEQFLSSVQVGITLIGIIAGAYGGSTLSQKVEPILTEHLPFLAEHAHSISFILVIGGITYFTILIGELVPKSIAINHAETIALTCVPIIRYFTFATYPFVVLLSVSTKIILKILRMEKKTEEKMSEEDLQFLLKRAGGQGVLESQEVEAHHNLFSFTDQTAESLMTHISEVESIDIHMNAQEVADVLMQSIHSHFLVVDTKADETEGIISAKRFFEQFQQENFSVADIVEEPIALIKSTPAFEVLNLFREKKEYFGVVFDDFGSAKGIVTLHDLMEAIVGDLPDENEEEIASIIPREDGGYLIDGRTAVHEINQYFQEEMIPDEPKKYTTLAGFLLHALKVIPQTGDVFTEKKMDFEIVDMDGVRIDKVLMKKK